MEEKFVEVFKSLIPWLMSNGVRIIFIVVGAIIVSKIITKVIARAIRVAVVSSAYDSKEAEEKRENTLIQIFNVTIRTLIFLVATLMVLDQFGLDIAPMIAAAGIAGIALGFGGQYLIRDIITGLFIILENQYRIGDVVNFDGTGGAVVDITLRKTTLRDLNGTLHHIPHGEIKRVANLTKDFSRVNINLGVAYSSKLEDVIRVINETGLQMSQEDAWKEKIISPIQFVRVDDFADSAIMVKVLGDTKVLMQWEVAGEFRKRIKMAFDNAGIEIPFPQRVIHQPK